MEIKIKNSDKWLGLSIAFGIAGVGLGLEAVKDFAHHDFLKATAETWGSALCGFVSVTSKLAANRTIREEREDRGSSASAAATLRQDGP